MKTLKLILGASLLVTLCLFLMTPSSYSKPSVGYGIGGKMVGPLPSLVGTLDINQFEVGAGGGMWDIDVAPEAWASSFLISSSYYYANGKYLYPLAEQVQPYIGAGTIGIFGSIEVNAYTGGDEPEPIGEVEATGRTIGYDIFGGLEVPLAKYGLPLTVYGGADYLSFNDSTLTHEESDVSVPFFHAT